MKHNLKITLILISMFVITQFIGLYVIHISETNKNPFLSWIESPEIKQQSDFGNYFASIIIAFIISIIILFLLTKFKIKFFLRFWFLTVIIIALSLSLSAIFPNTIFFSIAAIIIAITLGIIKVFKRNFIIHNLTELLIYPGIATVFVPILNFWSVLILLIIISIYDIWAVWHSGIMQKMAKYQIDHLKIFSGFFVPYISKRLRERLKKMKKSKKHKKVKINLAILGGGDIVFPIITSGVMLRTASVNLPFGVVFNGGIIPALFVIAGATLGLTLLFIFSEKKKFYPAMPFITGGIFLGMILSQLLF